MSDTAPPPAPALPPVPPTSAGTPDGPRPGDDAEPLARVGARYIWLQVLGQFGVFVAFITPIAISLAIRVDQLAPGHEEYLGYVTGAGAAFSVLTGVFVGVWSDRTRTRIGRRRPFMIGGVVIGVGSLVVMALAPSVAVLALGWVLAQLGWGSVLGSLQTSMADRLPEEQRGRVAGLTGFATQVAPVLGVGVSGALSGDNLLLFLVPGAVGVLLTVPFIVFVHEPDNRHVPRGERLTPRRLLTKVVFNPREHTDYAWNWLGRFLFYFGLTFNTTFTAFFFASRLGVSVAEVAPVITGLSLFGILATTVGAIGGGFLSDRLRRRRAFVLGAGVVFAAGAVTMAFADGIVLLAVGSLLASVGIGAFSAVDQALLLDVLPRRGTEAMRFMAIFSFATSIPQAVAPLLAPFILAAGASAEGGQNYLLLYLVAGICTVLGGLVVLRIRSVR
ncbi:MFS transporter [Goodfellowiella coeruleoviolacea]|uniref:MFS-type transporter involved in bile tolerance, Atg22 family n=1 Tax=Goodfellowiella coeruleoviolacea TaxID=334858 RepID=A0AAE3GHK7_9PSEU|nr:MFS transporter [Goodfellowiella coeruleoviolacea]MCP2167868.1 MFS-type transporter involved in bile tolerance, Atg22 family [Goodfellowiella coeruleoviolacea]